MPPAKTPGRWPYRNAKPTRTHRVLKRKDAPRGVARPQKSEPRYLVTRFQARVVFAAVVAGAIGASAWWAWHSPYLTMDEARVTGTQRLTPHDVRAAAGLDGDSLFALDLEGAEARVAALPEVREAQVTKDGWTGVSIVIEERTAWGSWQINGVNVPIDEEGHVLAGVAAPEGSPIIVEVEPQRVLNPGDRLDSGAVELAARLVRESDTAFGRRVIALAYRQNAGLTAVLSGPDIDGKPLWVTFGDDRDYEYKVAALYVLLEQAEQANLAPRAVDLRFGDRLSFN